MFEIYYSFDNLYASIIILIFLLLIESGIIYGSCIALRIKIYNACISIKLARVSRKMEGMS